MASLTESLITAKTKGIRGRSDFGYIKSLNLWGQDLTDVSILTEIPHVSVVSLSSNSISSLATFASLTELTELYLRRNNVSDPTQLRYLSGLEKLRILWLAENPIADIPEYRRFVVRYVPHLDSLDGVSVTQQERIAALDDITKSQQGTPPRSSTGSRPPGVRSRPLSAAGRVRSGSNGAHDSKIDLHLPSAPDPVPHRPALSIVDPHTARTEPHTDSVPRNRSDIFSIEQTQNPSTTRSRFPPQQAHQVSQRTSHIFDSEGVSEKSERKRPVWLRPDEQAEVKHSIRKAATEWEAESPDAVSPSGASVITDVSGRKHTVDESSRIQTEDKQPAAAVAGKPVTNNDNVLFAVLSLVKSLDGMALDVVHHEVERLMRERR
ncbi:hypothetical protein BJ742DRAFT_128974 [Cladochytrium replicatum]|nr:hypothetical protein BJ742DRAFT_128974 [Cladochytrium replicatum]